MKTKLTLIFMLAYIMCHAQTYNIVTNLYGSGTLTNATTNSAMFTTNTLDVRQYKYTTFVAGFRGAGTDASGTLKIWFSGLYDQYGTNYLTQTNIVFTLPLNSTNTVALSTNIDNGGLSYLKPTRHEFTGSNNATNFFLWATQKGYMRDR